MPLKAKHLENTTREIWINKKPAYEISWTLLPYRKKTTKDQFNRMVISGNQWLPKYYKHDTHTLCSISSPHPSEDPTCKNSLDMKTTTWGDYRKAGKVAIICLRLMIHPMLNDKSYPPKTHDCFSMKRILSYEALVYASKNNVDPPTRIRVSRWSVVNFSDCWFATEQVVGGFNHLEKY